MASVNRQRLLAGRTRAWTAAPRRRSARTRFAPTKPAAPVTRTCLSRRSFNRRDLLWTGDPLRPGVDGHLDLLPVAGYRFRGPEAGLTERLAETRELDRRIAAPHVPVEGSPQEAETASEAGHL